MSEELYDIVFKGELVRSYDLAQAKANIGRLFKVGGPKLDALFSGRAIVLKKNVNFEAASKYRVAIKNAGARVDLVPVAAEVPKTPNKAVFGERPSSNGTGGVSDTQKARDEEVSTDTDSSGLTLAPPGALLADARKRPPQHSQSPDISGLSLRDMDGDLLDVDEKRKTVAPPVAVGEIDLAPAGGDLLRANEKQNIVPRDVDISALSLAKPGALPPKPPPSPPPIDLSGLSLKTD